MIRRFLHWAGRARRRGDVEQRRQSGQDLLAVVQIASELFGSAVALLGFALLVRGTGAELPLLIAAMLTSTLAAGTLLAAIRRDWAPFFGANGPMSPYEYHRIGAMENLHHVVRAGTRSIGPAHPDQRVLSRRISENPDVVRVYGRERSDGRRTFCGYMIIYPLRNATAEAILSRGIRAAGEFAEGSLSPTFDGARYLYIGMVLGTDRHAQPHMTDSLRHRLRELLASDSVTKVFARAGTKYGLGLMKRYGFTPIHDEADTWFASGASLKTQLWAESGDAPPDLTGPADLPIKQLSE